MGVGDFTPTTVRHAFFKRERGRCFRCRRLLRFEGRGVEWSAHHRRPRGSGGTSNVEIASVANCLILCGSGTTGCHGWVERFRASAREYGYLVPLNGITTPETTRVKRQDGTWWLLTRSGLAVEIEEGDAL